VGQKSFAFFPPSFFTLILQYPFFLIFEQDLLPIFTNFTSPVVSTHDIGDDGAALKIDGKPLGILDGTEVGTTDSTELGFEDGPNDGIGEFVGAFDGVFVGTVVGAFVVGAFFVGASVGTGTGLP